MKFASFVCVAAGAVMLTGCSSLVSLNPFVTDQEAIADPSLAGTWKGSDGELYVIEQSGPAYTITYSKDKDTAKFQARVMKAGDLEVLDLVAEDNDPFRVPVHVAVRIWPEGSSLRWTFLDSQWLREQAGSLAKRPVGDRTMLMAPGDAVRELVMKYGADAGAYQGDPETLTRQ